MIEYIYGLFTGVCVTWITIGLLLASKGRMNQDYMPEVEE